MSDQVAQTPEKKKLQDELSVLSPDVTVKCKRAREARRTIKKGAFAKAFAAVVTNILIC